MQTEGGNGRFKGLSDCFLSTIRKEGPLALYKGASPPLVGWVVMDAAMLGSLNNIKLFLQGGDPNRKLELWGHALAGGLSGCVVAFVSTPIEVVKGRLQLQCALAKSLCDTKN